MNSAWRSTGEPGDVDDGHLIIGSIFAEKAINRISDSDYKIAVFHHPFENHAEFDRDVTEPRIAKSFDLICTGHNHRPHPEKIDDIYGSSVRSKAGSLYAGSRWFNGYQVIEVDFVQDVTKIYCREYFRVRNEFDKAANLTNADPVVFDFFVKNKNIDDQVQLFVRDNKDVIRENLLNHINFTSNANISSEALINGFAGSKLFSKGDGKLDESGNFSESFKKINLDEILSKKNNIIFYGPRQTGKTALKLYVAYRYAFGIGCKTQIPVNIDVNKFGFNLYSLRRAIASDYQIPVRFDIDKAIAEGSFVFLFEDIGRLDEPGLKRLNLFIENFAPSRSIVFGCPGESSVAKERHFKKFLPDFQAVGLGELTRGAIRKMAESWFEDASDAKSSFELVIGQMNRDGLPKTAYIVSLLLWAARQGKKGDRLNEAILLQNVLDHLLDRADFRRARRGALTTRGKELLLSRLANLMEASDGDARSASVITMVDDYFQTKKLNHDSSEVVDELINCGILARSNGFVSFRYRCFQEYYIDLGMMDDADFVRKAGGRNFLLRPREVELLSGLRGQNDWLINNIVDVLLESVPRDLAKITYADFEAMVYPFIPLTHVNRSAIQWAWTRNHLPAAQSSRFASSSSAFPMNKPALNISWPCALAGRLWTAPLAA